MIYMHCLKTDQNYNVRSTILLDGLKKVCGKDESHKSIESPPTVLDDWAPSSIASCSKRFGNAGTAKCGVSDLLSIDDSAVKPSSRMSTTADDVEAIGAVGGGCSRISIARGSSI